MFLDFDIQGKNLYSYNTNKLVIYFNVGIEIDKFRLGSI